MFQKLPSGLRLKPKLRTRNVQTVAPSWLFGLVGLENSYHAQSFLNADSQNLIFGMRDLLAKNVGPRWSLKRAKKAKLFLVVQTGPNVTGPPGVSHVSGNATLRGENQKQR